MLNELISIFYGDGYQANDFEIMLAILFFYMALISLIALIKALMSAGR